MVVMMEVMSWVLKNDRYAQLNKWEEVLCNFKI